MAPDQSSTPPLQASPEGSSPEPVEASSEVATHLTLKEAARTAEVSDSTLRRLVKADEVPYLQEETRTGFRYLFEPSAVSIIAHKAAMRRPSGRPSGRKVGGTDLQASTASTLQEASGDAQELATLRVERDMLRTENARLWTQIDRLTDSVTQLALPPSRPTHVEATEQPNTQPEPPPKPLRRSALDWFLGRRRTEE